MPQREGLTEGQVFAGYTIVRRLGTGGMGEVYLAQHPRLPRRDALKILPRHLTADDEFRRRFNREADLAASLYNEHIVGIHDRGEYQGQLWISMDYVEGTDAARLLREKYPSGMPKADVTQIIAAVADALDYAHSRGLLHRDVKPGNILLSSTSQAGPRRRILLADFGIARELGDISGLTATNMLVGTTAYCAPEQLTGMNPGTRADQYALGCTAFQLLTGVAPFNHSNPAVVISEHLSAPPPLISERRPDLAELDPVIVKVLAKSPDDRYPTCADFASALAAPPVAAWRAAEPGAAISPLTQAPTEVVATPRGTSAAPPKTGGGGRHGAAAVLAALATAALLAVAAVVGVHMLRGHSNQAGGGAPPQTLAPTTGGAVPPPSSPAITLSSQVTDQSGVLGPVEHAAVERAVTRLYDQRGIRLWVVYVTDFGGLKSFRWAEETMRANGFTDTDAMLAVATDKPSFSFRVPEAIARGKAIDIETIRRDRIGPAVYHREWARAAIAAANGLDV
jgi:serine/threonine-protein kinase